MKHAISITETLSRVVVVEAPSADEAQDIVEDKYNAGEIVLDNEDYQPSTDFAVEPDYPIDNEEPINQ